MQRWTSWSIIVDGGYLSSSGFSFRRVEPCRTAPTATLDRAAPSRELYLDVTLEPSTPGVMLEEFAYLAGIGPGDSLRSSR